MTPNDRIKRILLSDWDPIGIRNISVAADEYDDYVEPVARMLLADRPVEKIAGYLTTVEVETT